MMPRVRIAPWTAEFGFNKSPHAAASKKPMTYRPVGSIPSLLNNATDSGLPVSLKYAVGINIAAMLN